MSLVTNLVGRDFLYRLQHTLLKQGWYIDLKSGKLTCKYRATHGVDRPWIYTNPDPGRKCGVLTAVCSEFDFITEPCLKCWKVCAKPTTIQELMAIYEWQLEWVKGYEGKDRFCKAGIETRDYVPQNYGAYFYCDSKEQGLERWKEVRAALDKINPNIPLTLKRYCTEFEIRLGPSDQYKKNPATLELENLIFSHVDWDELIENPPQPQYLRDHVMRGWFEHAWKIADMTVLGFNDGMPLYTPCVTYHEEAGEGDRKKDGLTVIDLGSTDLTK